MRLPAALVMFGIGGAVVLQGPLGDANALRRADDFRYAPRPEVIRAFAGAHTSTAANILWLRALPTMSRPFDDVNMKQHWLEGTVELVTDLEPNFYTAYQYGAAYVGLLDRTGESSIEILEKGVARNPGDTRLRVDLGMAYWEYRKDRKATLKQLERAARDPLCPELTLGMLAALQVKDGEDLLALAVWERHLDHANPLVAEQAERNLEITKRQIVNRAARQFAERTGKQCTSKDDLRLEGLMHPDVLELVLAACEIDPDGTRRFPRLEELEIRHTMRAVEIWCWIYQRDARHWPSLDEILRNPMVRIQPPPEGQRWAFDSGRFFLEPSD